MTSRAIRAAVLLAALPTVGCGTVANLARPNPEEGRIPFGGVKRDVACLQGAATGELGARVHPKSEAEPYPHWAVVLLCAADLPFTVVGDVVTCPYAVIYSFVNRPVPVPPLTFADPTAAQVPPLPLPPAIKPMPLPVPPPGENGPKAPVPEPLPKPKQLP